MKCRVVIPLYHCIILLYHLAEGRPSETAGSNEIDALDELLSLSPSLSLSDSSSDSLSLSSFTLSPTTTLTPTKKVILPDERSTFYCFPIPLPSSDILTCSVTPGSATGAVEADKDHFEVRLSVLDPEGVQSDVVMDDMYKSMEHDRIIGHYHPKQRDQALSVSVFICNHRNKKRECTSRGTQIQSRSGFLDVIIPIKVSTPDLSIYLTGNMSKWMSVQRVNGFFSRIAQLANRGTHKVRLFPSQFQTVNLALEKNDRFFSGDLVKMDFIVALLDPGTTQPVLEAIDDALNHTRQEYGYVGSLLVAGVPFDRAIGETLKSVGMEQPANHASRKRPAQERNLILASRKFELTMKQYALLALIIITGIVAVTLQQRADLVMSAAQPANEQLQDFTACSTGKPSSCESVCIDITPPQSKESESFIITAVPSHDQDSTFTSSKATTEHASGNTFTTMSSASSANYDQSSDFLRNPQNLADRLLLACEDGTELVINFSRRMTLAAGGQAKVYFGIIPSLGASVAVKEMSGSEDSEDGDRFCEGKLEHELLRVMRHCEHVVHVFGSVTMNNRFYMVSEYITHDLKRTIQYHSKGMELAAVRRFVKQIVYAVREIHALGVVHRDLKPANILVTSSGTCKIADFGIALRLDNIVEGTRVRSISGTCAFTPPEALQRNVSYATDIWAIGCCVLEMMTGVAPWARELQALEHRDYNPDYAILNFVRTTTTGPSVPDNLPHDALDFIGQCLQIDPKARPQAKDLLEHPFLESLLNVPSAR